MKETVIEIKNVTKKFRLYSDRPTSLKETVIKKMKIKYTEFYALRDISFNVKKGSTLGLIGTNGSGKSTLLKIINRTMFPDKGKIKIRGKVASLIELGAGFHPELSGRENIYNNATIFGFSKEEIDKRMPEIIAFSELGEFIDNALRTYSSGMYARLAFSVAIHVDADILLVDEILGVGDINFQAKCANKIYEMKHKGPTIILVTHDMSTIDRLCDYAVWLDKGVKVAEGKPKTIENAYLKFMAEKQDQNNVKKLTDAEKNKKKITYLGENSGNGDIIFTNYKLLDEKNVDRRSFYIGQKISLKLEYYSNIAPEKIEVNIGFEILTKDGRLIYSSNMKQDNYNMEKLRFKSKGVIELIFDDLKLLPGDYKIGINLTNINSTVCYDCYKEITEFKIYGVSKGAGIVDISHSYKIDGENINKF